ncbi:MAG TPA: hydantoinase/oxoprolinase family protein [Anaerolineales bacterium]|nr:hydantoinase/oxoprolinase family protein [Anaerolineales bacterium]
MRIGIDIGGTFTDFVLFDEDAGRFTTFKVLSTPANPAQAVLQGMTGADTGRRPAIIHGSTVATNALLERSGAATAFVTTAGFGDILTIGRQSRSDIYDFMADRPEPLIHRLHCFEINERVDHHGQILHPLALQEIEALAGRLQAEGLQSIAVSLLFSFMNPAHEARIAEGLRKAGFSVSVSSEILPEFREYERASTTAINAYVSPIMDRYLADLERELPTDDFRVMQSNGGSISAAQARVQAVRSILSGPAGGVVGALHVARTAGFEQVITFDMGGTSTDVSLSAGGLVGVTSEAEIGGLPIRIPVIDIHTVGSGGGSIAYADPGGALRVGPQSAGADPGPVCYDRGGSQPTVTDADLALGRLAPDHFLGGAMRLDVEAPRRALTELGQMLSLQAHPGLDLAQTTALGIVAVANAHMARALRVISVERGFDPADFVLLSFGGSGGLHCTELARSLGMRKVLIPPGASTLSAYGMLTADVVKDYVQTVMLPESAAASDLEEPLSELAQRGRRDIQAEGFSDELIRLNPMVDVRYVGQSYELTIPFCDELAAAFHQAHRRIYGHSEPSAPVEFVNVRMQAVGAVSPPPLPIGETGDADPSAALLEHRPVVLGGTDQLQGTMTEVPFYDGEALRPGQRFKGPAVVVQKDTTIFLGPNDQSAVDSYFNLIVEIG